MNIHTCSIGVCIYIYTHNKYYTYKLTYTYTYACTHTHIHIHTRTQPYRNSSFILNLRTMTKRPLLFYVYSIWKKHRHTEVDSSNEMTGSHEDLSQKESHETMAENTSKTATPQVAETDLKESQPEMAEQTKESQPEMAEQTKESQPEMTE